MKVLLPALLALLSLGGCAHAPSDPVAGFSYGRLILNEPLTIPPDAATVRLQYGRVVPFNGVQEQDPFCVFELDTVAEREQAVRPGRFTITRVGRSIETFAGMPAFPYFSRFRVGFGGDDGGPTHIYFKTIFRLHDDAQPVRALTCMSNQMAPGNPIMRHLTLEEIRRALGGFMTLEFPV